METLLYVGDEKYSDVQLVNIKTKAIMNDKYFMALSFMVYFYKTNAIFEICIPESTKKYAAEPSQAGSASYNTKYKYN